MQLPSSLLKLGDKYFGCKERSLAHKNTSKQDTETEIKRGEIDNEFSISIMLYSPPPAPPPPPKTLNLKGIIITLF